MERIAFCIDLDDSRPEVLEFSGKDLEEDLQAFNVKNPIDLTDFDRIVFNDESKADDFLIKYNQTKRSLSHLKRDYSLPCMLYKRRFIVLAIMGLKTSTERDYDKQWRPGQLFQFHDQVHFLTVRLKTIRRMTDEHGIFYKYDYELV